MRNLLVSSVLSILLLGCSSTKVVEVPVPSVHIEYRDRVYIDTLYRSDSTVIKEKGDTIFLEKYKYLYRTREIRDTVNITDTITTVKTVEVLKEVNKLRTWQIVLMVLGGAGIALVVYKLVSSIKNGILIK